MTRKCHVRFGGEGEGNTSTVRQKVRLALTLQVKQVVTGVAP
jgi:hypothetical protein